MKRLIVNADDLGRSAGVDDGILRAHREGIVTSATLMTNAPSTQHAASLARATPTLAVGVHLVLTYARPLSNRACVRRHERFTLGDQPEPQGGVALDRHARASLHQGLSEATGRVLEVSPL